MLERQALMSESPGSSGEHDDQPQKAHGVVKRIWPVGMGALVLALCSCTLDSTPTPQPTLASLPRTTWATIAEPPGPSPSPAATGAPCVLVTSATGAFVPTVEQLWPGSPSTVSGFRSAELTRSECRRVAPSRVPRCTGGFPWGLSSLDPETMLATSGATRMRWGFLRGAPATKPGVTVYPLEVQISVFDGWPGSSAPADSWLLTGARACGRPTTVAGRSAFTVEQPGSSSEGSRVALLAVDSAAITWLDFAEGPWTDAERLRVAAAIVDAVAKPVG